MGIIHYKYDDAFSKSLMALVESHYDPDESGSPCWVMTDEKLPFGVTLDGLKTASDVSLTFVIDYLDNHTGYLRLQYDASDVLTSLTMAAYANDGQWKNVTKTITGKLNNILADGDFQVFSADAEDDTADETLTIRRCAVLRTDTNAVATWQTIGLEPVLKETFAIELGTVGGGGGGGSLQSLITPKEPVGTEIKYGMTSVGDDDATTNPVYFKVTDNDTNFWRDGNDHNVTVDVTYMDTGTEDIEIDFYRDSGVDTVTLATRGNTDKWVSDTATIEAQPEAIDATIYIQSDTSTPSDPIVDTSASPHTINNSGTTHSSTAPKFGASSLDLGGFGVVSPTNVAPAAGAFTLMFWAKLNQSGWIFMCEVGSDNNWYVGWYNGGFNIGYITGGNSDWEPGFTGCNDNTWHHYYVGSDGAGNFYAFFDGGSKATRTYTSWGTVGTPLNFGSSTSYSFTGYLDDFYYKYGSNKYTENFTVPATPLDENVAFTSVGESGINFAGDFSTYDADLKLYTTGNSELYISSLAVKDTINDAEITWG